MIVEIFKSGLVIEEIDGKRGARIALVPLQAEQVLGLLRGTLRVDVEGPQIPANAKLYTFPDGDSVAKQLDHTVRRDGKLVEKNGFWLGIHAPSLDFVEEGAAMPTLDVRFIPNE